MGVFNRFLRTCSIIFMLRAFKKVIEMTKGEINHMVERFSKDAVQRKKSRECMAKIRDKIEEQELRTYFKPKINNNYKPSFPEQFDSRLLSEKKEARFKHVQSPPKSGLVSRDVPPPRPIHTSPKPRKAILHQRNSDITSRSPGPWEDASSSEAPAEATSSSAAAATSQAKAGGAEGKEGS